MTKRIVNVTLYAVNVTFYAVNVTQKGASVYTPHSLVCGLSQMPLLIVMGALPGKLEFLLTRRNWTDFGALGQLLFESRGCGVSLSLEMKNVTNYVQKT